jgi:hypothetical protein
MSYMCAANYCVHITSFLLQLPLPDVWSLATYSFWVTIMLQNVDSTVLWLVVFVFVFCVFTYHHE